MTPEFYSNRLDRIPLEGGRIMRAVIRMQSPAAVHLALWAVSVAMNNTHCLPQFLDTQYLILSLPKLGKVPNGVPNYTEQKNIIVEL